MALFTQALFMLCCSPVLGILLGGSVSATLPAFSTIGQPLTSFIQPATSFIQPATSFVPSSSFASFATPSFAASSLVAPSFAAPVVGSIVAHNSFNWVPGQPITFGTPKPLTSVSAQKMDAKTLAKLVNADDLPLLDKPGLAATERLYDQGSFRNWNIEMAQRDIDAMNADPTAEKKFPCKVTSSYGAPSAKTFDSPSISCRYKGSVGSLRMCVDENNRFNGDCRKLSWSIDSEGIKQPKTPKINGTKKEDHTIHGAKNIAFGGCAVDWSLMSERMSYSLLNALNVTAPVASHAKLFLNGRFLGVYSFVQPADTTFARERFLGDKNKGKGALYKQVWFNQWGMQKLEEERKGGSAEDDAYMRTIMATIDATPLTQDAALKMFTKYFDTKAFIDVTALNSVIGATDDWRQRHNFYWYVRDGSTGKKVVLLPWDYDRLYDEQALRRGALGSNPWWDISASATTYACSAARMQTPEQLAAQAASTPSEIPRWVDIFKTLPPDNQVPVTCDKITKLLSLAFGAKVRARTREFINMITLDQVRNWFKTWNAQLEPALTYDPDGPTAFKLRDEQNKLLNHLTSARNLALAQANMADRPANAPLSTPLFRSG